MKFLLLFFSFIFSFSVFSSPFFNQAQEPRFEKINYSVSYAVYSPAKEKKDEIITTPRSLRKETVSEQKKQNQKTEDLKIEPKNSLEKEPDFVNSAVRPRPQTQKKDEIIKTERKEDELKTLTLESAQGAAIKLTEKKEIKENDFNLNEFYEKPDKNPAKNDSLRLEPLAPTTRARLNYNTPAIETSPLLKETLNESDGPLQENPYKSDSNYILNPDYLENEIVYPEAARRMRMEGRVVLQGVITGDGKIENLEIISSSGFKILDKSALFQVKNWRFIPPRSSQGQKTSALVQIPVKFELK